MSDNNREFVEVTEKSQMSYLVEEYLDKQKVFVKGFPQDVTAKLEIIYPHLDVRLSFKDGLPGGKIIKDEIVVYTIVKRYIEISLTKLNFERTHGEFAFNHLKIANSVRGEQRIDVEHYDFLAENFRLSKYSVDPKMKSPPICVQLAFDTLRPLIEENIPGSVIGLWGDDNKKKDVLAVLKTQKIIYIKDIFDESSFDALNTDLLDYKDFLGTKFEHEWNVLKQEKIRSLITYPVVYTNIKGEQVVVGYMRITNATDSSPILYEEILPKITQYADSLMTQIRNANIQIIKASQMITNVSKGGIQIKVADNKIIDIFHSNKNEIVFDIRPKPTFRFTIFATIANMALGNDERYTIGMKFIGGEQRHGISAWHKYIDKIARERNIKYV